jgi:hypothetical protein
MGSNEDPVRPTGQAAVPSGQEAAAPAHRDVVPGGKIAAAILVIRGERVLLDTTLADLYGVTVSHLNQAARRNRARFPSDFMFRLEPQEIERLRSQSVISNDEASRPQIATSNARGGRRYRPYAFTEHGVAMLSSVLRSPRAVQVNIEIMRAFVRLRRWLADHAELAARLDALERRYDERFRAVFDAIRALMQPAPAAERSRVGFRKEIPDAPPGEPARGHRL